MPFEILYVKKIIPDAYHGTSRSYAKNILIEGFVYVHNEAQYLGDGVYFFESSMWNAQWWAKNRHPKEPCVIQAEIDLGKCFDLNNGIHRKYLGELYGRLQMETRMRAKSIGSFDFKPTDAALIELLARECKIDTVRAVQVKTGSGELFKGSRFLQYQDLVICVRNTACILKYEIVEGG